MKNKQKKRVYCSGPLFCPEEIALMSAISDELENAGYETFLPHRDGLEPYIMKTINNPHVTNKKFRHINNFISKAIFAMDLYQVVYGCDYLVFNMNGRVPDEGGVVETAVAFASGKPLVIYKNDYISKFNGNDNSMLTGLSFTFNYAKKLYVSVVIGGQVYCSKQCRLAGYRENKRKAQKKYQNSIKEK